MISQVILIPLMENRLVNIEEYLLKYPWSYAKFPCDYRAQNEAYKIEKTKKWEKSMNDRELER